MFVSSCGSGSGTAGDDQIEFWGAFPTEDVERYFQQSFVDAYNETTSGATVEMSVKQIETIDRLTQTAVASGSGPDIIATFGPAQAVAYVGNGNLLSMDEYADSFGWSQSLQPWALDAGRVEGALYSVPANHETMAVFYNPATFSANGWTPPTTRAEFEAICQDAADKGIMPVGAGNAEWKPATEWHVTWMLNTFAGPQAVYEVFTGERPWTDAVVVDAVTLLKGWFDDGWFGGSTDRYFTNNFTDLYAMLAAGEVAMIVSGSWTFSEIGPYFGEAAGNDAEWDWAPLPSTNTGVPAGVLPLSVGGAYSINKDCADPDAAADYLNFLVTNPQRQLEALAATGLPPAPVVAAESDFPADIDERMKRLYLLLSESGYVGYTTWTFLPAKTDTYVYEEMDKVLVGQVSPEDFCAGLDAVFQEELATGQTPPVPAPTGT
ncbi:ABC transporter substrate-binding protein [Jiangella alkaliphila]|nr:ABC transporter substrate-binding protein [Jiangella alkaliphila]